jgi:hypothetical protein
VRSIAVALIVLTACRTAGSGSERLGDTAWHDGRWSEAVALYQAVEPSPRVTAKLADAAFLAGSLTVAADAWSRLARESPERAGEAASGLARTAVAAEREDNPGALVLAIAGLRRLGLGWPLGRLSLRLAHDPGPLDTLARSVIPAALAASPGRRAADSLLLVLGRAQRTAGDCRRAVPTLQSAARRGGDAGTRDSAAGELGLCELDLGLRALSDNLPAEAERWLDRAARGDPLGWVGRRAMVGLGDARFAQGDFPAAALAWQTVAAAPVAQDSITVLALARLRLGNSGAATDSTMQGHP